MEPWIRAIDLPASTSSVPRARDFVTVALSDAGMVELLDDARLVISELASNAVLHARTPFTVVAEYRAGGLQLSVRDGAGRALSRGAAEPFAECGRGLLLVEVLSAAWGIEVHGVDGKRVWARLPASSGAGE